MRRRPALEPRVGADVGQPERLALAEHDGQHAVLTGQRADRLALAAGDAVHHELGDGAVVVGHAERRVPGARERAHRTDDDLEHVADRQFPGDGEDGRADPAEHLVLAGRITAGRDVAARSRRCGGTRAHGSGPTRNSGCSAPGRDLPMTRRYRRGRPCGSATGPRTNVAGEPDRTADAATGGPA